MSTWCSRFSCSDKFRHTHRHDRQGVWETDILFVFLQDLIYMHFIRLGIKISCANISFRITLVRELFYVINMKLDFNANRIKRIMRARV